MARSPHLTLHVTPRDADMIEMVYAYHGCGVQHLHARFWPEESTLSATYRRVSRLAQAHYLTAQRLPSLTGQGSGKAILALGARGRRVLAERRAIPLRALPRLKLAASTLFVHHHFAVCDVRVALELAAERTKHVQLAEWLPEATLKRQPMKVQDVAPPDAPAESKTITLIPDGAFLLRYDAREQPGMLEMDMGTLAPKRLQQKLRGYLLLYPELRTPVFFVAPSEQRVQQIRRLAESEAARLGADPSFVFLTTRGALLAGPALTAPIWQQCTVTQPVALLPTAQPAPSPPVSGISLQPGVAATLSAREP